MDAGRMHELACRFARARTEEALNLALEEALPLCAMAARRFSGRGVEYEDLYQVACLACVAAIRNFEPERGLKFTTFVTPSVIGSVRNYIRDKGNLLHTARSAREDMIHLNAAREDFLRTYHEEPTPRELAEKLEWDLRRVMKALSTREAMQVASLDRRDEDGLTLGERISGTEAGFERAENRADLRKALAGLTEKERRLLALRYRDQMSQREAATKMNMTQMQISRMERRILAALQTEMEGKV